MGNYWRDSERDGETDGRWKHKQKKENQHQQEAKCTVGRCSTCSPHMSKRRLKNLREMQVLVPSRPKKRENRIALKVHENTSDEMHAACMYIYRQRLGKVRNQKCQNQWDHGSQALPLMARKAHNANGGTGRRFPDTFIDMLSDM